MPSTVWQLYDTTTVKFNFRTDLDSGMLFFGYGGEGMYYYMGIIRNSLYFRFSNGIATGGVTFQRPNLRLCDGNWYRVVIHKEGQKATIEVDGYGTETSGNSSVGVRVATSGEMFMGGIPDSSDARRFIDRHNLNLPLEGWCEDKDEE